MNTAPSQMQRTKRLKRVDIRGRAFIVKFGEADEPLAIMERKSQRRGLRDTTYWHRTHRMGGPNTLVRRVLTEAGVDTRHFTGH